MIFHINCIASYVIVSGADGWILRRQPGGNVFSVLSQGSSRNFRVVDNSVSEKVLQHFTAPADGFVLVDVIYCL